MPDPRSTALTEEEQRDIAFLKSVEGGWSKRVLAIIHRLDAEVLAGDHRFLDEQAEHTETFKGRERLAAQVTRLREALSAAIGRLDRFVDGQAHSLGDRIPAHEIANGLRAALYDAEETK